MLVLIVQMLMGRLWLKHLLIRGAKRRNSWMMEECLILLKYQRCERLLLQDVLSLRNDSEILRSRLLIHLDKGTAIYHLIW